MAVKRTRVQKNKTSNLNTRWPVKAVAPPRLSDMEWGLSSLLGLVLIVMAVLQLVSFSDFKDLLDKMGLPGAGAWAICIILAELWGAIGFFKLPMSRLFRLASYTLAVAVSGFWFVQNLQLISNGIGQQLDNSGFFGRFLAQQPGWWTALEVSVLLFATVYKVGLLHDRHPSSKR
jgi:hypothetical protein